jgi:prepilin-type processing-associated H-X9-DG protein
MTQVDPRPPQTLQYASSDLLKEPIEPAAAKSLGFGLFFFFTPLPPILAIVYGIISLRRLRIRAVRGRAAAWSGMTLGILGCALWTWIGLGVADSMRGSTRVACISQLRGLGNAIHMYARTNSGELPGGWDDLIAAGLLYPRDLICPGTTDTPATGATTQAVLFDYHAGGHTSYVYLGHGRMLRDLKPATVTMLAYEVSAHGKYVNVLFADGHVECLRRETFMKGLQDRWSGRVPTTTTYTTSTQPATRGG